MIQQVRIQDRYLNDKLNALYNAETTRHNGEYQIWLRQRYTERQIYDQCETILHELWHVYKKQMKEFYKKQDEIEASKMAEKMLEQFMQEQAHYDYWKANVARVQGNSTSSGGGVQPKNRKRSKCAPTKA